MSDPDYFGHTVSEQYMQKNEKCFNFALTEHLKEDKTQAMSLLIFAFTSILCRNFVFMKTLSYYIKTAEKPKNSTKLLVYSLSRIEQ